MRPVQVRTQLPSSVTGSAPRQVSQKQFLHIRWCTFLIWNIVLFYFQCGVHNFKRREHCFKCNTSRERKMIVINLDFLLEQGKSSFRIWKRQRKWRLWSSWSQSMQQWVPDNGVFNNCTFRFKQLPVHFCSSRSPRSGRADVRSVAAHSARASDNTSTQELVRGSRRSRFAAVQQKSLPEILVK